MINKFKKNCNFDVLNTKENITNYFGRAITLLFFLCIVSVFSNRSIKNEPKKNAEIFSQISTVKATVTSAQSIVSYKTDKITYPCNNFLFSGNKTLLLKYQKFLSHKLKAAELNNKCSVKPEIFAEHYLHFFIPIGQEPFILA